MSVVLVREVTVENSSWDVGGATALTKVVVAEVAILLGEFSKGCLASSHVFHWATQIRWG
jgi:hypothetical protein